jgi:hypothetical protein
MIGPRHLPAVLEEYIEHPTARSATTRRPLSPARQSGRSSAATRPLTEEFEIGTGVTVRLASLLGATKRRDYSVMFVFVFGSVPASEALMPPRVVVTIKVPLLRMLRYMPAEVLTGCFVR